MSFTYLFVTKNKKPSRSNFTNSLTKNSHSNTKIEEDNWKIILGRKERTQYLFAQKLASEHIKNKKPVTFTVINDILAYCNISITEDILNSLINAPSINLKNLDQKESKRIIKNNIGLPSSKIQIPGVFIFKNKITGVGEKYVGSSSILAIRLFRYFNDVSKTNGKFIPLLLKDSLSNFSLEVIPLVNNSVTKFSGSATEVVLEQYYLLDPSFTLNTVKVANNPSGSNGKPFYMYTNSFYSTASFSTESDYVTKSNITSYLFPYQALHFNCSVSLLVKDKNILKKKPKQSCIFKNSVRMYSTNKNSSIYLYNRDKSILYFVSNEQDFVNKLGFNRFTLKKKIDKGLLYLNRYTLTRSPLNFQGEPKFITFIGVKSKLDQDRIKFFKGNRGLHTNLLNRENLILDPKFVRGLRTLPKSTVSS